MYKALRAAQRHQWRGAALATGAGCTAILGFETWRRRPVLLADSSTATKDWTGRSTVVKDPAPPHQTTLHQPPRSSDAAPAENDSAKQVGAVWQSIRHLDLSHIGEHITNLVVPSWAKALPSLIAKLQNELSMAPWSLSWEIWEAAHDPEINPEIIWDADVRISNDLCAEEEYFLQQRKPKVAKALARYLDLPESEVHPDDVPVIAMCGSGGGLRALVAGTSSHLSAQEAGLFDCTTYTAGVSGSCWLQTLYYSSIGRTSHARLIEHFKRRLQVHIAFPPPALNLMAQAPTNRFLLSGLVEKLRGVPDADFGLVDVYGMLLAARLMVPSGELDVSDWDLKISNQRYFIDQGDQPLPIYTAVRHELQLKDHDSREAPRHVKAKADEPWFQWFEWTPYEFFCEELSAGIPTWAVGREFYNGRSVWRDNGLVLPELRIPLMIGIWGSAFCATLSHYYKEIQPVLKASGLGSLDQLLVEQDDELAKIHPFDPATISNFALGLKGKLPPSCPESIYQDKHFRLMDAGMSNNLPIYPLLRPGRDVDVIVAFDASADAAADNWIKVAEGYAKQRRIKGWPMGAGWPPRTNKDEQTIKDMDRAQAAAQDAPKDQYLTASPQQNDLGHCTVWVGTTSENANDEEPPPSKRLKMDEDEHHLTDPNAGIAVIYFPLTKNAKVTDVDPLKSDFLSTWNFVYTPKEIDSVVALAQANFEEGQDQTKRTIRAVWERKRQTRLTKEKEERDLRRRMRMRRGEALGKKGEGDHFS